jgi:hypothetical protein
MQEKVNNFICNLTYSIVRKLPLHEPAESSRENIFDHVINGFDSLAIGPTAVRSEIAVN